MTRTVALATLVGFSMGGCDLSEPLTPVTEIRTPLLQAHADPQAWAQADDAARQVVWAAAQGEFRRLRRERDYPALLRLAREVHHLFPEERKAWLDLSTALLIMGDFGKTLTAAHGALEPDRREDHHPDEDGGLRAQAWCNIASAQIELRQHERALESADRAIALRGDFAQGHLRRGEALQLLGEPEGAVASYQRAFALGVDTPDIVSSDYLSCSKAYQDMGDLDGAVAVLRAGLAKFPVGFGLHHFLALVHQRRGEFLDAYFEHSHEIELLGHTSPYRRRAVADLAALARRATAEPDNSAYDGIRSLLSANQAAESGRAAEAIEIWQGLLNTRPEDDRSIHLPLMIARTSAALGQTEEAERWHRRVLERDPNFVPSLVELAELMEAGGESDRALELIQEAHRLDPRSWRLLVHLDAHPERREMLLETAQDSSTASAASL